ncbi:Lrp/AsnC family transcriptional regulator [Nesterenkonia haasae]|uniref:Lrp/AsnC family transcriptional regulator n=1 Tax=Nesterenkonia haasae TaxID=2587813 RepID=UPI001291ADE7|nr:Lrp/AsnC family transcriptional regulator [Nesterenkonia haasae]NDK32721.1 Lrp/AsnC family transcriptional regulator [Nesterenkonia haasae]
MKRLTDLDRALISELRRDGRAPVSSLADRLGVSRATVTKRIDRLTAEGVIVGFSVRIRDPREISEIRAISLIELFGRATSQVIAELRGYPEITALHTTNGAWDMVAEISCRDLQEFDALLSRLRGVKGIMNSETSLLLSSVVR